MEGLHSRMEGYIMGMSRVGYFNTFYSESMNAGKDAAKTGGYFAKYGETLTAEDKEQEKDGLHVKQENVKQGKTEVIKGSRLRDHLSGEDRKAPYYHLSDNGIINYNGVTFVCDTEHNQLHLGDTSNPKNCLTISLSGGGSLVVNRDNIDQLAKAISMFSPEDVNLIMRALHTDAKAQQMLEEIEDEECSVGEKITEGSEDTGSGAAAESSEISSVTDDTEEAEGWQSTAYQSMTYSYDEKND